MYRSGVRQGQWHVDDRAAGGEVLQIDLDPAA